MTHTRTLQKNYRFAWLLSLLFLFAAIAQAQPVNSYVQTNLVSDGFVAAAHVDKNLVNPWGIAVSPFFPNVVAENGTGLASAFFGDGVRFDGPIVIPAPSRRPPWCNRWGKKGGSAMMPSAPTGAVFNTFIDADAFLIRRDEPAAFLFATEDGTIAAWSFGLRSNRAVIKVDNSATTAVYKGLAIAADGKEPFLFATDFHNNRIDVFSRVFRKVALTTTSFTDPLLPPGFAPFGIQNVGGNLYVTYAQQDAARHDNVNGVGLGFVDVYDVKGKLLRRFASGGLLNAPWGVALAPGNFGLFSNSVLIGNFGDGFINAFALADGAFLGQLRQTSGTLVANPGLWGIAFGNGVAKQPTNTLFFAAGIDDEMHGLYGKIEAVPTP